MVAVAAFAALAFLASRIVSDFVTGTLTDERVRVERAVLAASARHFSGSPRLHAKLARAELSATDGDLAQAEYHARRAIELSPYDYRFPLLMASIKESKKEEAEAHESLRRAIGLAPNNADARWHLANLLLRRGEMRESIDEFRAAVALRSRLAPLAFDLVYQASRGDLGALEAIAGDNAKSKVALARFLLKQSRATEAVTVFSSLDTSARLAAPESSAFIDGLIAAGHARLARELWLDLKGTSPQDSPLIWNGGFESYLSRELAQFDWAISRSDYARFAFDASTSHSGTRSFRIDFIGRAMTRLDQEIKQLIVLRAGARYRLECYAKAARLIAPEGPRVAVTDAGTASWLAASEPVGVGADDWQRLAVDFAAPPGSPNGSAVYVSIKLKPQSDDDGPTSGTVWLDDFVIREQ
jgi:Tfp pilus assembly protein PilF